VPLSAPKTDTVDEPLEASSDGIVVAALKWWGKFILIAFFAFFAWLFVKNFQAASVDQPKVFLNGIMTISLL
jgi:hypothetical protein